MMKIEFIKMRFKCALLLLVAIFYTHIGNAQTVTDPWATLGASNIQTSFIAMDASNNLYVTNKINSTISKITPNGTVTQAWASLGAGSNPYGITIDAAGNLYTVNRGTPGPYTVSKITPTSDGSSGTVIQTWASLGAEAYTISVDASGNLYVPYISNNKIAKIVPANGGATGNITNPWVTLATGANPFSISFDASGNIYSANSNNTISKITPAGVVTQAWATLAASSNPQFMVFDPTGNMYVSCWGTSTVSKINSSGTVTNVWSLGTSVWPAGIVLDDNGNIYTANYNNNTISKITSSGTVTQAYATLATGTYPFYLAKDASGNLYNTNMGNGTVSKVSGPPSVTITSSASGAVCAGTSVTFTANAINFTSTPTYQWYKNGAVISGETNATYITSSLANADQIYVTATPGYASGSISTSNLIANFDAANYNPTSTRWNDLSASGNHMNFYTSFNYTTLKTATYSSDGGGSLNVNNNNVYGRTINNTGITGNGAKTMSAWVKFDAADRDWTDIANFGSFAGWAQLFEMFGSRNGSGYQIFLIYSGSVVAGATTIPLNTWAYITISADGPSIKIYVNGILDGSANQALSTVNSPLYLGNSSSTSNYDNLRGKISTLSLWNSALSGQTILDNYNATKGRYAASAGYTSNIITSSINASPAAPSITVTGDGCSNKTILTRSTALGTYAWYKDNVAITGVTSNTYTPTAAGDYHVQVTSGSCSNTSTVTTIYTCVKTPEGKMLPISASTRMVTSSGEINNKYGVDEKGLLLTKPYANIPTGTNPVTTGLILYLDATRSASYGGSGNIWTDISGQSPAGSASLVGNPTFGSGNTANGSGSFTFGSNINAATSKTYTIDNEITYIAWVNPSQSFDGGVIVRRTDTYGGATSLYLANSNLSYDWDNANWSWRSNLTVPNNQWSMIVISVNAGSVTAYLCNASGINSVSSGRGHGSLSSKPATNFHIGYDPYDMAGRAFKGKMGTAMVYSVALSTSDITSIFTAQKASFGL